MTTIATILAIFVIAGIAFLVWNDRHTYAKADGLKGRDGAERIRLPNGRSAGYDVRGNFCGVQRKHEDIKKWAEILRRQKLGLVNFEPKARGQNMSSETKSTNIQIQMMIRLMAESEPCLFHNSEENLMNASPIEAAAEPPGIGQL
jgi:uncharacterized protein (DUF779 family)